jgi:hypothetical protein
MGWLALGRRHLSQDKRHTGMQSLRPQVQARPVRPRLAAFPAGDRLTCHEDFGRYLRLSEVELFASGDELSDDIHQAASNKASCSSCTV